VGKRTGRQGRKIRRGAKQGHRLAEVEASKLGDLAARFALLGSEPRLRLLMALADGPRDVTSLCEHLNLSQPNVSTHLMRLQYGSLVASARDGRRMVYHNLPGSLAVLIGTLRLLVGKV